MKKQITVTVNGRCRELLIDVRSSLLEMLREELKLTGTKQGCAAGECGACTVSVDGEPIDSCICLAVWADGKSVTTIEGIASPDGTLSGVQQNFIDSGAIQCGFCTPGLVIAATALLDKNPHPTRNEIRRGLSGNLCRCTGYQKIVDAVENTSRSRSS
jgi:carbon-monoxide dehydrogenase small subunit